MRLLTANLILVILFTGCEIWTIEDKPGTWEYVTEFPGPGRERAVSFVIDEAAYIGLGFARIGDNKYDNSDSILLNDFWEFDPTANIWTKLSDFPWKTTRDIVGFAVADRGYILIQDIPKNTMWEYNPSEDEWKQLPDFPGYSRTWAICFTVNNKAYFGLGNAWDPTIQDRIGATDLWEYNPILRTWIRKADFPGIPREYAISFTIENKAYICTGSKVNSSLLTTIRDVWEYNTETDNWIQKTDFSGYSRYKANAFSLSERGYIGTGRVVRKPGSSSPYASDFWEYDNNNDLWRRIENYPSNLIDGLAFVVDNKCFIGLGDIDRNYYTKEIYQLNIID